MDAFWECSYEEEEESEGERSRGGSREVVEVLRNEPPSPGSRLGLLMNLAVSSIPFGSGVGGLPLCGLLFPTASDNEENEEEEEDDDDDEEELEPEGELGTCGDFCSGSGSGEGRSFKSRVGRKEGEAGDKVSLIWTTGNTEAFPSSFTSGELGSRGDTFIGEGGAGEATAAG
jgi:hypothetical protein